MSILTTFEAVPGRLLSLYEVLFHRESGMDEAVLEASSTPKSLRTAETTQLYSGPYSEARNMGMIEVAGGKVRLTDEARCGGKAKGDHEKHFRMFLRRVLFDPERAKEAQQGKFLLAISWFLTQNPLAPIKFSEPVVDQINAQIENGARELELQTPAHSQNLLYWARYLGFATMVGTEETSGRRVIPDPYRAIGEVLDEVFNGENELDTADFLGRLSSIYPCLETGRSREEFSKILEKSRHSEADPLSVATSLALQRLEDQQRITLSTPPDSLPVLLDFGLRQRRVSRIELRSAS
ncbi:protein DpdG [Salipiger bermudensis]|uniref:protein DpdG n=1 Tax=Salipiger bermudensis TaxID=344736 RepID=UPI002414425C|nr:protein DpdG [Salipiger bermudensis]